MTQGRGIRPTPEPDQAARPVSREPVSPEVVAAAYLEFKNDLLAFLIGVLKDGHAAQDALQQTFQKLAEVGQQAQQETLRGWLFQVAYREAMLVKRKQQTEARHRESWWHGDSVHLDPTTKLIQQEQVQAIQQALGDLPAEQRQILERRIQGDETFAEIAESLSTPLGTVLTRMRLALQRLRKQLSDD